MPKNAIFFFLTTFRIFFSSLLFLTARLFILLSNLDYVNFWSTIIFYITIYAIYCASLLEWCINKSYSFLNIILFIYCFFFARFQSHCWKCGDVFCTRCIDKMISLPGLSLKRPVPVCRQCYAAVTRYNSLDSP